MFFGETEKAPMKENKNIPAKGENIETEINVKLEDAYLKITKEKEKYFVQIFDENIFEEKIEISKPKDLEIKLNKKIPIWIH